MRATEHVKERKLSTPNAPVRASRNAESEATDCVVSKCCAEAFRGKRINKTSESNFICEQESMRFGGAAAVSL